MCQIEPLWPPVNTQPAPNWVARCTRWRTAAAPLTYHSRFLCGPVGSFDNTRAIHFPGSRCHWNWIWHCKTVPLSGKSRSLRLRTTRTSYAALRLRTTALVINGFCQWRKPCLAGIASFLVGAVVVSITCNHYTYVHGDKGSKKGRYCYEIITVPVGRQLLAFLRILPGVSVPVVQGFRPVIEGFF